MNERSRELLSDPAAERGAERAAGPLRSVLVPVDLTPSSDRVLGRVALLPLAGGARVTLLHVVPEGLGKRESNGARRDAEEMLEGEARRLRDSLPGRVAVKSRVVVGSAAKEIAACATTLRAELLVMGRGRGRPLRDLFLGSTAERVIRRGQLPVLVVRLPPHEPYERPAVALDLDDSAEHVLGWLLRVLQPPRPRVDVIHAFEAPYHGLVYPSMAGEEVENRKRELARKASLELSKLLARSLEQAKVAAQNAPRWTTHVRHGSARRIIQKAVEKSQSDLLVLGTRGYSSVVHMFLGTVAGDVLRGVACDTLVVPPVPPPDESRSAAAEIRLDETTR